MPDMTVPAILFALVLLILLGQWLMVRRARSMRGQPVPETLVDACQPTALFKDVADMNVLVVFDAPQCGACRKMVPALEAIGERYPDRVVHLSVAQHRALAQTLRIMGTPTIVLVSHGQIVDVFVGITPLSRLLQRLAHFWPEIAPVDVSD